MPERSAEQQEPNLTGQSKKARVEIMKQESETRTDMGGLADTVRSLVSLLRGMEDL